MFPDMGEMSVISVVLQLLKTLSDVDLLVSRRCLMLVSSVKIFIQLKLYFVILPQSMTLFPLSIPPTTGYHSVRIFMLSKYKTTTLSLLNKNAALEIIVYSVVYL